MRIPPVGIKWQIPGEPSNGEGCSEKIFPNILSCAREGSEKMNTEQKRDELYADLVKQLEEKGLYKNPYKDLVERYMAMWGYAIELENDIIERGVCYPSATGVKKNDSVSLHINTVKQMGIVLDKLDLQAKPVKKEGGIDV